jgi:glycosyltransferase involved in cell wall biosynthesis
LVNDHPPNVETVGDAGLYFPGQGDPVSGLSAQLGRLLDDPELVNRYRARALERATKYSWEAVTDEYEKLLLAVREAHKPGRLPPELVDLA